MTLPAMFEHLLLKSSDVSALRVLERRQITPHMLRITFTGKNLERFSADDNLHVRLVIPPETENSAAWATVDEDGLLHRANVRPHYRKYTIRNIDAAAGRIDIDFAMHVGAGPATAWASRAQPNDLVGIIGPGGRSANAADWYLIVGDDSALPAIARIAQSLPTTASGKIIIEVDDERDEQPIARPTGISLRWLHRLGKPPGSSALLLKAVVEIGWPPAVSSVFAWVAGEAETAAKVRRHLKKTWLLDKEQQLVVAYWSRS